jgi:hypothetical protein
VQLPDLTVDVILARISSISRRLNIENVGVPWPFPCMPMCKKRDDQQHIGLSHDKSSPMVTDMQSAAPRTEEHCVSYTLACELTGRKLSHCQPS